MVTMYRFDDGVLRKQIEDVLDERAGEVARIDRTARTVLVRRTGRAAAGAVGIGGGLLFLGVAVKYALAETRAWYTVGEATDGLLVELLLGVWGAMGVACVLGRLGGHALLDRVLGRAPQLSGQPGVDLARLRRADPRRAVIELLDRARSPSLGWPLAAMGLLLPLTLHLGVWIAGYRSGPLEDWRRFDEWIRCSVLSVGLAHLVLAACCVHQGKKLGARRNASPATAAVEEGFKVLVATSLAASVPGVVLLGIPPLVTAVTGAAFVPLMFYWAARQVAGESAALADLDAGCVTTGGATS